MNFRRWVITIAVTIVSVAIGVTVWILLPPPDPCRYLDEPKCAGIPVTFFDESFDPAVLDYFREMDGGVKLSDGAAAGRNTWMIWTAGDEAFWNVMAKQVLGGFDLLKTLSSYRCPSTDSDCKNPPYSRDNRFAWTGLTNEPGFRKAESGGLHGLWLDERVAAPEPFREEVYGKASGIVGLRLFANPNFDEKAAEHWDAEKYFNDSDYYSDRDLVRPYRVGMSCAFCHVGPSPTFPPKDTENPEWSELSSIVGAQYFWTSRIFGNTLETDNFFYQVLESWPLGTLDTSAFSTDNIANPSTMNAIYDIPARMAIAQVEILGKDNLASPGTTNPMPVPHVLKDGSDSIGILAALSRVYVNIGEFHQEWLRHFNLLLGGTPESPIKVTVGQKNSVYWNATDERMPNLVEFLKEGTAPHHLKDAPGGSALLSNDPTELTRGKIVFADNCAMCHSSKWPEVPESSSEYAQSMRDIVLDPTFLDNNYLSDDRRKPLSLLGTNMCRPLGENALAGHVWGNYSSETYKNLEAMGWIEYPYPFNEGETRQFNMKGGGRGYTRTPSLISLWSTAPFLLNNSVGKRVYDPDPSVEGRMQAFDDAIEKMLWPETRDGYGSIVRTTEDSFIKIKKGFLPAILRPLLGDTDQIEIGPIPAGTPVGLLTSLKLGFGQLSIKDIPTIIRVLEDLIAMEKGEPLSDDLKERLLALSNCPDFVVDRGHEFGSQLSDDDKRALIEFLKYF